MAHTFTSMTLNLWGDWDFARRRDSLARMMSLREPDLLGVQELCPQSAEVIDAALPHHERVHSDGGWLEEGNLWWNTDLFEAIEHGFVDIGHQERYRGLFWVKLKHRHHATLAPLVLATAHLTFPGNPDELRTERSPRTDQARAAATALQEIASDGTAILCLDANDYARPLWAMYDAGFRDPFGTLGRTCPFTFPVTPRFDRPMRWEGVHVVEKVLDWHLFIGELRPRCAEVVDFFLDNVAPSDHKPVVTTFTQHS
ncbi:endonuclease/exonuclease/phosphatase family protein [Ruania albidiflava]|uniref:endonuclease/exonuclease/phosphatase family protein n=1 Tax=Ruania albidiflava TaxID=366586 RepID=UPI0012FAFCFD|nr:endonuclease/exonuclease/phosphatase family protein [Ruania albidiflava]